MDVGAKKLKYWVLGIILLVVVGVGIKFFTQPAVAPDNSAAAGYFTLAIDYGDENELYQNIPFTAGETLFSATQKLTGAKNIQFEYEDYGDLGMLVTGIGDRSGGEGGAYWQYWVNGNYAQIGASAYAIQSGDSVEWRLTNAQQ
ncbi:MAG: DUF4430 domain-containing protein [Candidatus Colwellbacteria bacterium]|nr:DUF4430 domain-containing protein [Candidatus Colwellbacteria bacterium]